VNGSFLVDTDDLGEAEEALSENFGQMRIGSQSDQQATRTRVWRTQIASLSVDDAEFNYNMGFSMEPPEKVLLCRVRSGDIEVNAPGGHAIAYGPGRVVAFGALDGVPISGVVHRARYDIVGIDRHVFDEVAVSAGSDPVRLTAMTPVSPAANQLLVDAMDHVRHGVVANSQAAQEPLMAGAVTRYIASCLLSALPSTAMLRSDTGDGRDGTPTLLRRAIAFVDDNAHTDISLADIAAAVRVTPRALQLMFRRHRGCTPTAYLRSVRLHHAHLELVTGNASNTSVAEIAGRWGFGHSGRFAACYRQTYGRTPHSTLCE
jgi:AraC-like DNA-binding protein